MDDDLSKATEPLLKTEDKERSSCFTESYVGKVAIVKVAFYGDHKQNDA